MKLNLGSLSFNADISGGGGTPAWGTELGQGEGYRFSFENMTDFFTSMVYCAVPDLEKVTCPLGKGGKQRSDYDFVIASLYNKIFVNGVRVKDAQFILLVVKKLVGAYHVGRRTIKYNPRMTYRGVEINGDCYTKMAKTLGIADSAAWFVDEINVLEQDELHFTAYIMDGNHSLTFVDSEKRKQEYIRLLKEKKMETGGNGNMPFGHGNNDSQIIYYGAPGTGKSFQLNKDIEGADFIRTIFHPDADYSSFVGCYKPIDNGTRISYDYQPQAFVKAYIKAWLSDDPFYLVIEEINRGNCAQIFGDIFQLLDRKNGVSEYETEPDADLQKFLQEEFAKDEYAEIIAGKNIPEKILSGEIMKLPANLLFRATMNTSDQSLFPMDSAFKRRWAWRYFSIKDEGKGYVIKLADGTSYDWWKIIEAINKKILDTTKSADKQLGYWFAKLPEGETIISADLFVSKVIFYLWNDVFKDYSFGDNNAFSSDLVFENFYSSDGKVVEQTIKDFMARNYPQEGASENAE